MSKSHALATKDTEEISDESDDEQSLKEKRTGLCSTYSKKQLNCMAYVDSLNFKEFDYKENIKDYAFSMSILACRRSGKTVLMKDLLSKIYKKYEAGYIFSETIELQPDNYDFVPKENTFDSFDTDKMQEIWDNQKKLIKELRKAKVPEEKMPHIIIIFDDVISDKRIRTSKIYKMFATQGRHLKTATITISQEVGGRGGIPKEVRANQDYIICFFIESSKDRELIITQFLSMNNKYEGDFILKKCTIEDSVHQAMVIIPAIKTINYEEKVKVYNAELKVPKFMIKSKEIRKIKNGLNIVEKVHNKKIINY